MREHSVFNRGTRMKRYPTVTFSEDHRLVFIQNSRALGRLRFLVDVHSALLNERHRLLFVFVY